MRYLEQSKFMETETELWLPGNGGREKWGAGV